MRRGGLADEAGVKAPVDLGDAGREVELRVGGDVLIVGELRARHLRAQVRSCCPACASVASVIPRSGRRCSCSASSRQDRSRSPRRTGRAGPRRFRRRADTAWCGSRPRRPRNCPRRRRPQILRPPRPLCPFRSIRAARRGEKQDRERPADHRFTPWAGDEDARICSLYLRCVPSYHRSRTQRSRRVRPSRMLTSGPGQIDQIQKAAFLQAMPIGMKSAPAMGAPTRRGVTLVLSRHFGLLVHRARHISSWSENCVGA